jgi:hypothetical protein
MLIRTGMAVERELYALETPVAAQAEAFALLGARGGLTPQIALLRANVAAGETAEFAALNVLGARGEIIVRTQFRQGAALRGLDYLSAVRSAEGLQVFLNEVSATAGNVVPSRLSALGLNRPSTFELNLRHAQAAVRQQVADPILQAEILKALRGKTFTVRVIGPSGVRISPETGLRIQQITGATEPVIILEALQP